VIVDNSANPAQYRLEDKLVRQEAIKVAAGVHGGILQQEPDYVCKNMFTDVQNGTWVCRIAELSRTAGLLDNDINTFRPTENLSLLEALDFSLRASKLMPAGKHTATQVFQFAADYGLIPQTSVGIAPDFPTTRGAYFYYLVKAMKAAEQPSLCETIPELCPLSVCGNSKKEGSEQCDDGNTNNYDWCSNSCVDIADAYFSSPETRLSFSPFRSPIHKIVTPGELSVLGEWSVSTKN
jgi:cysteine-rich repeat protein